MTNKDVMRLWAGLTALSTKADTKFSYVIYRNKKQLSDIVESLLAIQLGDLPGKNEFETERLKLCKEYAAKDQNNNPILRKVQGHNNLNEYQIANTSEFNSKMDALLQKHQTFLSAVTEKKKQIDSLMAEKAQCVDLIKIHIQDLPSDLTASEIEMIEEIIIES